MVSSAIVVCRACSVTGAGAGRLCLDTNQTAATGARYLVMGSANIQTAHQRPSARQLSYHEVLQAVISRARRRVEMGVARRTRTAVSW